jgi:hypothetical protein
VNWFAGPPEPVHAAMGEEYESTTPNVTDSSGRNELLEGPVDIGKRGFVGHDDAMGRLRTAATCPFPQNIHKSSGMCHIGQGCGVKLPTRDKEATHG